jgi:hypothetical protein
MAPELKLAEPIRNGRGRAVAGGARSRAHRFCREAAARGVRTLFPIVLAVGLFVSGCVGPGREAVLDGLVGQDLSVAIETLGQPGAVVELGEGRRAYLWQRLFVNDFGPPTSIRDDWRSESTYWFDDEPPDVPGRLCSTRLAVGFDLVIESWDYACETVTVDRVQGRARRGHGEWFDVSR